MERLTTVRGVWVGGTSAGLLSWSLAALFLMSYAALIGIGFFKPMQLIAGMFFGSNLEMAGASSAATGLLFSLGIAVIVGVIFAAFLRYSTRTASLIAGLLTGLFLWVIATYIAVPLLNRPMARELPTFSTGWLIAYLVFGACLMATPHLVMRFSHSVESEHDVTQRRPRAA